MRIVVTVTLLPACFAENTNDSDVRDAGILVDARVEPDAETAEDAGPAVDWTCYCHAPEVAIVCAADKPICAADDPSDEVSATHCGDVDGGANCFCTCTRSQTLPDKEPGCYVDTCFEVHPPKR